MIKTRYKNGKQIDQKQKVIYASDNPELKSLSFRKISEPENAIEKKNNLINNKINFEMTGKKKAKRKFKKFLRKKKSDDVVFFDQPNAGVGFFLTEGDEDLEKRMRERKLKSKLDKNKESAERSTKVEEFHDNDNTKKDDKLYLQNEEELKENQEKHEEVQENEEGLEINVDTFIDEDNQPKEENIAHHQVKEKITENDQIQEEYSQNLGQNCGNGFNLKVTKFDFIF